MRTIQGFTKFSFTGHPHTFALSASVFPLIFFPAENNLHQRSPSPKCHRRSASYCTVCHSTVVPRTIQCKVYGIKRRTKERSVTHVKVRTATGRCLPKRVLLCLDLFGRRSRDQLSQTADFVHIHLVYPPWFTGTLHLDQTALCLRTIRDKPASHFCSLWAIKENQVEHLDAQREGHHFQVSNRCFFFFPLSFFFQGPPLVSVREQSRLVESNYKLRVILFN